MRILKTALLMILSPIFYALGFLSIFILGSIYILLTLIIHPRHLQGYVRIACRVVLLCFGQWLRIEGRPPDQAKEPYLYLPNHESMLDMFMLGAAIPRHFCILVAEYHFKIPFWRTIAKRYGGIPIERRNLEKAIGSVSKLEQAIIDGKTAVVFFEGTRSSDGLLQKAKKGPFYAAKNTKVTLVPCGIVDAFEHMSKASFIIRPGVVIWRWGEPIPLASDNTNSYGHLPVNDLADLVRTKVGILTGELDE